MKYKKAQVTMYIIIGLLLLGGILFYVSTKNVQTDITTQQTTRQATTHTPTDAQPIVEMGNSCLGRVGEEALILLGQHGGYVDTSDLQLDGSERTLLVNPISPTDSEGIAFSEGQVIPYWDYILGETTCRAQCTYASKQPQLEGSDASVQSQIQRYIERELPACMEAGMESLQKSGYTIETSTSPKATVTFPQGEVQLRAEYPLQVRKSSSSYLVQDFTSVVDLDLKAVFEQAQDILQYQIEHQFFEVSTINLISANTGTGPNDLPPIGYTSTDRGQKSFWIKSQVRRQIQDILATYSQFFQVEPSRNYERPQVGNSFGDVIAERMTMPLGTKPGEVQQRTIKPLWRTMEVDFLYLPLWPIYLNIRGDGIDDEFIGGRALSSSFPLLSFFETNNYEYYYDVSYPVLVTIRDSKAFKKKGYTFQFALEVNLQKNNDPQLVATYPDGSTAYLQRTQASGEMQTCERKQRNSHEITVRALDAITGEDIEDVRISYACGQNCHLGYTTDRGMRSKFPICVGGQVKASKPGYVPLNIPLSTIDENRRLIIVPMYETKEYTIDVKKFMNTQNSLKLIHPDLTKHEFEFIRRAELLEPTEEVMLTITPHPDNPLSDIIPQFVRLTGDMAPEDLPKISLVPGTYKVSLLTVDNRKTLIPQRWYCEDFDEELQCESDPYGYIPTGFTPLGVFDAAVDLAATAAKYGTGIGQVFTGVEAASGQSKVDKDAENVGEALSSVVSDKPCSQIDSCIFIEESGPYDVMFKGQVEYNWTFTEASYRGAENIHFFTITSPDGYNYLTEEGHVDLLIMDLVRSKEAPELAHIHAGLLRPTFS